MRPDDLERCRLALRAGSKSFHAASRLLPDRVRGPATALYAFCRSVDDAIDDGSDARAALDVWRNRLERAYAARPLDAPTDRAFAWVAERFSIPKAIPEALLEGMQWDAEDKRYETEGDLIAYGARVASSVGVMMTLIMGHREPEVLARACDLGVAMQITNVCRDVGEDAARGRVYLPAAWLREAGVDRDAWLRAPVDNPGVRAVVARALSRAELLYARSDAGIMRLPRDCRLAIRAARLLYADIGRVLARRSFDGVTGRAVVSTPRKLWLLARSFVPFGAWGGSAARAELAAAPPLEETAFLVNAGAPARESAMRRA
jgi:phytoene synthase